MVKRNVKKVARGLNPSQKQRQTQIVNVNLGSIGKRVKRKKINKRESKASIPAFNPPSIVNFPVGFNASMGLNQPNVFQPLSAPPPQRQYAVFAEGEQQRLLNTTPTIPVPFTFVGATEKLKAPAKEERLVPVPTKAEEEIVLPTEAEEAVAMAEALAEAEAAAIEGEAPATAEEEAAIARGFAEALKSNLGASSASSASSLVSVNTPVEASVLLKKEPILNPFNLPTKEGGVEPLGSAEEASLASYTSGTGELSLPQSRFLGGSTLLFSPPLKAESEESRRSFPPLPSSGLTLLPPIAPSKTSYFGEKPEEKTKRGPGRPAGSANRPKEVIAEEKLQKEENLGRKTKSAEEKAFEKAQKQREGGQTSLGFPTTTGSFPYLQLEAGLGPEALKSRATKEVGGLERRRGGGVITPAEDTALGAPPAFLNAPIAFLG